MSKRFISSLLRIDKEEKIMSTYEKLQTLLSHDLLELRQIQKRGWLAWPMARLVTEEHLGRCCYIAEEFLDPAELCKLKSKLGLDEQQWRAYKVKITS
jgi:hypothetical protein